MLRRLCSIIAFAILSACHPNEYASILKRFFKLLSWAILAITILLGLTLSAIALLIDPNDFKPLLVRTVYEKKQRTLNFEGPIKLRVFPRIALDLGRVSLSEYRSREIFMAIDKAELEVAWLPLLKKRLVVEGIRLDGISARVIRYRNGVFNFADLLQQETPSQIDFDIATLSVRNGSVVFDDRKGLRTYTARKLALNTGRLVNRRETEVVLSGELIAPRPRLALGFNTRTRLTFDTRARRYQVRGLDLSARGQALNLTEVALRMRGDASLEKTLKRGVNTQLSVDGKRGDWRTHVEMTLPSWLLSAGALKLERPQLAVRFERGQTRVGIEAKAASLQQQPGAWSAGAVAYTLNGQFGGTAVRGQLSSPLAIDTVTPRVEFKDVSGVLGVAGQRWNSGGFKANLRGRMTFAPRDEVPFTLVTNATAHTTKAYIDFALDRLTPLHSKFSAKLDKLELDRFLSRGPSRDAAKGGTAKIPELKSDGDITIGELSYGKTRAQGLRIEIRDD